MCTRFRIKKEKKYLKSRIYSMYSFKTLDNIVHIQICFSISNILKMMQINMEIFLNLVHFLIFCIYPTPPLWVGCNTKSIFSWSTGGLNFVFLFLNWLPYQKLENKVYSTINLLLKRGDEVITFTKVLA